MSEFSNRIREASVARVSVAAMLRELGIGKNFVGRSAKDETSLRVFSILKYLFHRGANGSELLMPPVDFGGTDNPTRRAPLLPFNQLPTISKMRSWMNGLEESSDLDPKMLQYCTVYEWPENPKDQLRVRMAGRSSLVALEAGALTVEAVQAMIDNSPTDVYSSLCRTSHKMQNGEVTTSVNRRQTLYVPPDYFVFCAIDSVRVRVGSLIINFPRQQGRTDRTDPDHSFAGNPVPAIMAGEAQQLHEPQRRTHLDSTPPESVL